MLYHTLHRQLLRARLPLALLVCLLALFACTLGGRIGSGSVLQQDWDKRRGPVVPHDNFPKDCSLCHEGGSWSKIRADFAFDHERETKVPLHGAHARAECLRCHNDRGPVEIFAVRGCVGCHEDVHRGKQGAECASCHRETDWGIGDSLALHERTRFPLFGVHASVECWRCHPGAQVANFDRTAVQCENCHQQDLASATNPNHAAQGWTKDCENCHSTSGWTSGDFNHSWWPLSGAHAAPPRVCSDCHPGGNYAGTQSACVACHQQAFDATQSPPHGPSGFPTSCQACHNTTSWQPATFTHSGVGFALDGAHLSPPLDCVACHVGGNYSGTLPTDCAGCHQSDFDATSNPDHRALGFPTQCANCHTTAPNWTPVHMDHTGLTGSCQQCHMPDYQASSNPDHELQGYPFDCAMCHVSTTSWSGVNWFPSTSHDPDFPLPHRNSRCNQCHTVPQVFTAFSCISGGCHGQSETNGRHSGVQGYQYDSNACYQCHANGQVNAAMARSGRPTVSPTALQPKRAPRAPPERLKPPRQTPPLRIPPAPKPAPSPKPSSTRPNL